MAVEKTFNGTTYNSTTTFAGFAYIEEILNMAGDIMEDAGRGLVTTSASSYTLGSGTGSIVMAEAIPYSVGSYLTLADTAAPTTNYAVVQVSSRSGTTLGFTETYVVGSGTKTAWSISIGAPRGATGAAGADGVVTLAGSATGAIDMSGYGLTVDLATVEAAGEARIDQATQTNNVIQLVVNEAPIQEYVLEGDYTIEVGGPWTPGHEWQMEFRTDQDGTGGRDITWSTLSVLTNSNDTSTDNIDSHWSRGAVTVAESSDSGNTKVSPSGWKVEITASGSGNHYLQARRGAAVDTNDKSTGAVLLKAGTATKVKVQFRMDTYAHGGEIDVNLSDGSVISTAITGSGVIDDYGVIALTGDWAGWYVVYITVDAQRHDYTSMILAVWPLDASGNGSYTAGGTAESVIMAAASMYPRPSYSGIQNVGASRTGEESWRDSLTEIDYSAQAASAAARVIVSKTAAPTILLDNVSIS